MGSDDVTLADAALPGRRWAAGLIFTLALAAPPAAAADAGWAETLAAALKEGEVYVHGGPGTVFEHALTDGFRKAYPGIKINFTGSSGRDAIPKITREREAGTYVWDVYVGGTPSILESLKPLGAFAPLRPALLLDEVLDDKVWRGGLDDGWMDKEKKLTLAFDFTISPIVQVNWDVVSHDELKTFADLLKPQFADKIVWDDPRLPGAGPLVGQVMMLNFGPEYLERLLSDQKIVFTTNRRQNAEWVVRGRYPIGLGTGEDDLAQFKDQGLGRNVKPFTGDITKSMGAPGFGTVSLMDRAPHPNAAKIYINWLLSRAGQTEWAKTKGNSRRLDVPAGTPDTVPQPGVSYINSQTEEQIGSRNEVGDIARRSIPKPKP
jgi:iron(III) transport system substrate-binding protein